MKTIEDFVEASLNMASAETDLKKELVRVLHIPESNIKSIYLKNYATEDKFIQSIFVDLVGQNYLKSDDICKIKGLTVITPNQLMIDAGAIDL